MSTDRANPFADVESLPAFAPKPKAERAVSVDQISKIAEATGFPSRQPPKKSSARSGRRYKTGRNQQINIKATPEVIERLYQMADTNRIPLGELLERALDALQKHS